MNYWIYIIFSMFWSGDMRHVLMLTFYSSCSTLYFVSNLVTYKLGNAITCMEKLMINLKHAVNTLHYFNINNHVHNHWQLIIFCKIPLHCWSSFIKDDIILQDQFLLEQLKYNWGNSRFQRRDHSNKIQAGLHSQFIFYQNLDIVLNI